MQIVACCRTRSPYSPLPHSPPLSSLLWFMCSVRCASSWNWRCILVVLAWVLCFDIAHVCTKYCAYATDAGKHTHAHTHTLANTQSTLTAAWVFWLCPFAFLRHNARLSGHNVCPYGPVPPLGQLPMYMSVCVCVRAGLILIPRRICWAGIVAELCHGLPGACWFLYCFFFVPFPFSFPFCCGCCYCCLCPLSVSLSA